MYFKICTLDIITIQLVPSHNFKKYHDLRLALGSRRWCSPPEELQNRLLLVAELINVIEEYPWIGLPLVK